MNKNQTLKTVAIVIATVAIISIALSAFSGKPQTSPIISTSPDLIIKDFYKEASSCTGLNNSICNFTLSAIVKNTGRDFTGRNVLEVSINNGTYTDYGRVTALRGGQSVKVFTGFLNVPQGSYSAYARADYLNQVNESNENNNGKTLNFQLP